MPRNHFTAFIVSFVVIFGATAYFFVNRVFQANKEETLPTSYYLQDTEIPKEDTSVTLLFTGDVMLGRTVEITARENHDFHYPFLKVADTLKAADITFANLENPIIPNCPTHTGGFTFCANPEMADGLTFAGIDIVTLANNHSRNYGQRGVNETVEVLKGKGIEATGLAKLTVIEKKGVRFGFLGFDFTNSKLDSDAIQKIKDADTQVDVVIVAPHWGVEYTQRPQDYQIEWASKMVEAGADVIVGSHPHWVQDSGYIEGPDGESKPIYYSLGNFVFDQMWSEETKKGLVMRLTYDNNKLEKEEYLPVYIGERGQPEFIR